MGEDGVGGVSSVWGLIWELCQYNCVSGLILSCIRPRLARVSGTLSAAILSLSGPNQICSGQQAGTGRGGWTTAMIRRGSCRVCLELFFFFCARIFFPLIWNQLFARCAYLAFINPLSYCEGSQSRIGGKEKQGKYSKEGRWRETTMRDMLCQVYWARAFRRMTHKSSDTVTSKGSFMRNVFLLVNVSTVSHPRAKSAVIKRCAPHFRSIKMKWCSCVLTGIIWCISHLPKV